MNCLSLVCNIFWRNLTFAPVVLNSVLKISTQKNIMYFSSLFGWWTLTKIIGKFGERDREFSRVFSRWECFCQNWRIIRQFWQRYSHFEKVGEGFLSFSYLFLMILVSEVTSVVFCLVRLSVWISHELFTIFVWV